MKLLLTSDWHMAGFGDPVCCIKKHNDEILRILDHWEKTYDLILLNGDIFESLKTSRVRFDHFEHTCAILEDRRALVDRFLEEPYLWTVGNHDYPLEDLLKLPAYLQRTLDNGMELFAEHGHLVRAAREFYSDYHTIYHVLYCCGWWSSKLRASLGIAGDSGDGMEALTHWYWRKADAKKDVDSLSSRLTRFLFAKLSAPGDDNLPGFMMKSAEAKYGAANGLITMGHCHCFQRVDFDAERIYVNTGRGYRHGKILGVELDTASRMAVQVMF